MRSKIIVLTILFGFILSGLILAEESALRVISAEGEALVKIFPSLDWNKPDVNQVLKPYDEVRTDKDGKMVLEFSDKSNISVRPESKFIIEELSWNGEGRTVLLNLASGYLRSVVMKPGVPADFRIKTPLAIVRAMGTVFYLLAAESDTRVFVTDGAVDFTNLINGNTYIVITNMMAIAELTGTVNEPRELTGEEREKILSEWSSLTVETYTEPEGSPLNAAPSGDIESFLESGVRFENAAQENRGQREQKASPV